MNNQFDFNLNPATYMQPELGKYREVFEGRIIIIDVRTPNHIMAYVIDPLSRQVLSVMEFSKISQLEYALTLCRQVCK
jgi:hypothetical protein